MSDTPPAGMCWRVLIVQAYHTTHGDRTIRAEICARESRPLTDPFFERAARKLARGRGKLIEWRAVPSAA